MAAATTEPRGKIRKRVVVVGGGFGGLNAALGLKNAAVDVTLVDRRNYHLFQPLLYQVALAVLSPADIAQNRLQLLLHALKSVGRPGNQQGLADLVACEANGDGQACRPENGLVVAAAHARSHDLVESAA